MLLDRTKTQSLPGGTQGPVGETDMTVSTSNSTKHLGEVHRSCSGSAEEGAIRRASWRHEWWFTWVWEKGLVSKQVFPGLRRQTSDRSIRMQEFWNHLRSNFSSLLVSCAAWAKLLHLSELWYPAQRATGGLHELVHLTSLERSRCTTNGVTDVSSSGEGGSSVSSLSLLLQGTALWLQILMFWPGPCGPWFPRNCRDSGTLILAPNLAKPGSPSPTPGAPALGLLVAGMTW